MPPPRPPPDRPPVMAVLMWLSRPLFLSTSRSRTAGWRYARDGPGFLMATAVSGVWAGLSMSPVLHWAFLVTTALSIVHAMQPSKDAHSYYLGDGVVGWVIGSQQVGRVLTCLIWMGGGLCCGSDYAARNYFLASGVAGLAVVAAVRKRDRDVTADLQDGLKDALARRL